VRVPGSAAGKKGKCPHCAAVVPIPQQSVTPPGSVQQQWVGDAGLTPLGNGGLTPLDEAGLDPLGGDGLTPLPSDPLSDPWSDLSGSQSQGLPASAPGFDPLSAGGMTSAGVNPYTAPRSVAAGTTQSPSHTNKPKRNGLPWDRRDGEESPFFGTVKAVLFSPLDAFYRMKRQGGLGGPLLFCFAGALLGGLATGLYDAMLRVTLLLVAMLRMPDGQNSGMVVAALVGVLIGLAVGVGLLVAFVSVGVLIGTFLNAALFHLGLLMVGGARHSFETTFRVVCYAWGATSVCQVIPFLGGLIGAVLNLVYLIMGLYAAHEITAGRAVAAVLLPLVLLMALCGLIVFLVFSMIVGLMKAASASLLAVGWILF
jgi:hypothetical protein